MLYTIVAELAGDRGGEDVGQRLLPAGDAGDVLPVYGVEQGGPVGERGEEGHTWLHCCWLNKRISHDICNSFQVTCHHAVSTLEQGGEVGEGGVQSSWYEFCHRGVDLFLAFGCGRGDNFCHFIIQCRSFLGDNLNTIFFIFLGRGAKYRCWLDPFSGGFFTLPLGC